MNTILLVFAIIIVSVYAMLTGNRFDEVDNNQFYQARATRALFVCGSEGFQSEACQDAVARLPKEFTTFRKIEPPH